MRWVFLFILALIVVPVSLFLLSRGQKISEKSIVTSIAPSPTSANDLSAIEISADKTASIAAVNEKKQPVGTFSIGGAIRPPTLPTTAENPMKDLANYLITQPLVGSYTVTVTAKETGDITFYLYDQGANVLVKKFSVSVGVKTFQVEVGENKKSTVQEVSSSAQ